MMRVRLLKIFGKISALGFFTSMVIVLFTYPNIPEGSFYNISNWTIGDWIISIPVSMLLLSGVSMITIILSYIVCPEKESGMENG
ncbi:hypothetical protein LCGC14_0691960 [marine sediment metagenome]|uniref:Uncharacterized protein n=1 Tax=marine sediment metagenome TaxID=412755 RepID=A0A0F9T6B2_9ZZZZ